MEIVYLCHSRRGGGWGGEGAGGGGVGVERGQIGTREREDNKWKSARSTLKVRKNTIFFIEKY